MFNVRKIKYKGHKMNYKDLKQETLNYFLKIKNFNVFDLEKKDIEKQEVLEDLMRFMIFFEELESKEKNKELKKIDYKKTLIKIKKYLNTLDSMIS